MTCDICRRRDEARTVVLGGRVMLVCETCYERGTEAAMSEREEPEGDFNFEGDPTRNRAFG